MAWIPAGFVLLAILAGVASYKPLYKLQRANMDAITRRQGLLYEAISGGDVIKSQGGEAHFSDQWLFSTREATDRNLELNAVTSITSFSTQFMQQTAYALIIIAGVYVIEAGELTLGGLIACSLLGLSLIHI